MTTERARKGPKRSERDHTKMTNQFTVFSLFSGGGLADAGYISAGYNVIGGIEQDPAIAQVYKDNFGHCLAKNIESVIPEELPHHADLVHMSPPCTNYSGAKINPDPNYRDLGPATLPIIDRLQPSVVVLENVYAYQRSRGFQILSQGLIDRGYHMSLNRVYCPRHGIPQTRKRLIVTFTTSPFTLNLPQTAYKGWYEVLKDYMEYPIAPMSSALWAVCDDTLRNKYIHPWTSPGLIARPGMRKQRDRYISYKLPNEPAFTVMAVCPSQLLIVHKGLRRLTSRAYAALQTVPDWYKLPKTKTLAKKVIGNGVPSRLTQLVGTCCLPVL